MARNEWQMDVSELSAGVYILYMNIAGHELRRMIVVLR